MREEIGDLFQRETKYHRGKLFGGYRRPRRPEAHKLYPGARKISLPRPEEKDGMPLWEALKKRRSVRDFKKKPLTKGDLSQLLWATQGISKEIMGYELRTAPSAGALYPIETYVIIHDIEEIDRGIYHYDVSSHELELLRSGDFRKDIAEASLEQDFLAEGNLVFVWTAVFGRSTWKYGARAFRYIYLDAGHIGQNLALAAVCLGLGSCQVGALYDDEVNAILGVDGVEESVVYMSVVGYPEL